MLTFFDTETTGLFEKTWPVTYEKIPRVIQLGAILTDLQGNELYRMDRIIRPEWPRERLHEKALEAHGFSYDFAMDKGLPQAEVLDEFYEMLRKTAILLAHNKQYDDRLIDFEHYSKYGNKEYVHRRILGFCTMEENRDIIKLPPTAKMRRAGFNVYKSPNLTEAHQYYFGTGFEGAHDAMADVTAVKNIAFEMINRGHIKVDQLIAS